MSIADRFRPRLHQDDRTLLAGLRHEVRALGTVIYELTQGISQMRQQIADLVAKVGPLVDAVTALETAAVAERAQIADLTAKLAAGTDLSAEEVQALADAGTKLSTLTQGAIDAAKDVPAAATAAATAAAAPPG